MHNDLVDVGWTEEQWNRVTTAVAEEAQRARVAAQILPVVGPEDHSAIAFADYTLGIDPANPNAPPPARLITNNVPNHTFTTIAVQVQLTSSEVAEQDLTAALIKFRRAANIVSRIEDAVIFNDRLAPGAPIVGLVGVPNVATVTGGGPPAGTPVELGLLPLDLGVGFPTAIAPRLPVQVTGPFPPRPLAAQGEEVTRAIIRAMGDLEAAGQSGPFCCALSPYFYEAVYVPNANFVAAKDRILPILNGPLVRSSAITDTALNPNFAPIHYGVVIALGGSPAAIRVAVDIGVKFLQTTEEPRYLFRVSERLGLRLTDPGAVAVLHV